MVSEIDKRFLYNRDGVDAVKIGQLASHMAQTGEQCTVDDVIQEMGPQYIADLEKCADDNSGRYEYPFYILVMSKKEMWATNVIRNFFIARQTKPKMYELMVEYPNNVKTLYMVTAGGMQLLWSLPDFEACKSIVSHPDSHDPQLLKWIDDCFFQRDGD